MRSHPITQIGALALALIGSTGLWACGGSGQSATSEPSEAAAIADEAVDEGVEEVEMVAEAVEVPLIPRDVLFSNPERVSPDLSPDGTMLAYLAPWEGALNVFVRTLGEDDDRRLTSDTHRGIRSFVWAANGEFILYIQDRDGDENWHGYAVPVAGGEAVDLTPIEGVQARLAGGIEPAFPDEILVGLNDRVPQLHDTYRINVRTGERELVLQNDMGAAGFVFDHEWRPRLALVPTSEGGFTLMRSDLETGEWEESSVIGSQDALNTSPAGFARDNETVYMIDSRGANTSELRTWHLPTGTEEVVFSDPTYDVSSIMAHPTTHELEAVAITADRVRWTVLDPTIEGDLARLRELHEGELAVVDRDEADQNWLVVYYQDVGPARYYHYDRASGEGRFLFAARPALDGLRLATMEPVSYQARDGLTIHAYLTRPVFGEAPHPMVLLVHGGPWGRDTWGYSGLVQWLANRGYAVLQPNFRGSTGYGKDFVNAGDKQWGLAMQDDLTDAVAWAVADGVTRADTVCIMGGSYGGYATLAGVTLTPEVYSCGVDIVGPSNIFTLLESIPPYWEPIRNLFYSRVGDPEADAELLRAASPLFHVENIVAPLLIGQGANDPRVDQAESDQIVSAMQERNIPVTYVLFPDEGHGFARDENNMAFFAVTEAFLAAHLGGRFEPIGDDFEGSSIQIVAGEEYVPGLSP